MILADLHIHTKYSFDSTIHPKILVEQLLLHPLIKVVAITDHDTVDGCEVTMRLASMYPDILVIPGVEISVSQGDILVLGTKEMPPKPWIKEEIVDFAKANDFVSIVAHPYREYGFGDSARNLEVDAIEVLNSSSSQSANRKAKKLARTMGLPGVAGTDAHKPEELWTVYSRIDASLDVDDVLGALKKGLVSVSESPRSIHF